jgi:hypothetical protein
MLAAMNASLHRRPLPAHVAAYAFGFFYPARIPADRER